MSCVQIAVCPALPTFCSGRDTYELEPGTTQPLGIFFNDVSVIDGFPAFL